MAYLDDTGLAYFWGKIKAYIAALLAPKANDSDVVHTTGNETISGNKTFADDVFAGKYIYIRHPDVKTGTAPSSNKFRNLTFQIHSANGTDWEQSCYIGAAWYTGGNSVLYISHFDLIDSSRPAATISIGHTSSGTPYTQACTPPSNSNSADIATTEWANRKYVDLTSNQTVGGEKTFTSPLSVNPNNSIVCKDSDGELVICAASDDYSSQGSKLVLTGPETYGVGNYDSGHFILIARNSADSSNLTGAAKGDLVWSGNKIYTNSGSWSCFINKRKNIASFKNCSTNVGWLGIHQVVANDNSNISSLDVRYNGSYTYLSLGVVSANANGDGISVILTVNKDYTDFTFRPNANGTYNLGTSDYRWKQLFAATTTISTSDRRRKESIDSIPDAVLDAWDAVDWVQFKFSSSVAEKGQKNARLHSGVIAQDIGEVFSGFGLDASRYGFFCYDRWDAEEASYDGDGNLKTEAREAGDSYSIRYEEALCMEAAYMRRENARLKKRIADLEERLAALELKVS